MDRYEELKKKLYEAVPDLYRIKPNPNNYPIIKKYNRRMIWYPNARIIYGIIESVLEEIIAERFDKEASKFADIDQIKIVW